MPSKQEREQEKRYFDEIKTDIRTVQTNDRTDAAELLRDAGMDPEMLKFITDGMAALIVRVPSLAQKFAARYPSGSASTYNATEAQYFGGRIASQGLGGFEGAVPAGDEMVVERGGIRATRKPQGVIVTEDQATGDLQVLYADDPEGAIPGSPMWLRNGQKAWSKQTIAKWKQTLGKAGYLEETGSDFTSTLKTALRNYFYDQYTGEPPPSKGGTTSVREVYDPILVDQDLMSSFNVMADDDPTEDELKIMRQPVLRAVRRALRHGASPEHAQLVGQREVARVVTEDPALQRLQQDATEEEDGRDFFTSMMQALGSL